MRKKVRRKRLLPHRLEAKHKRRIVREYFNIISQQILSGYVFMIPWRIGRLYVSKKKHYGEISKYAVTSKYRPGYEFSLTFDSNNLGLFKPKVKPCEDFIDKLNHILNSKPKDYVQEDSLSHEYK